MDEAERRGRRFPDVLHRSAEAVSDARDRPTPDGPPLRRRAAIVVLVAGVAVLGFHAARGVLVTRDVAAGPWRDRADGLAAQDACLAAATDALVPVGSRVHLPTPRGELQLKLVVDHLFERAEVVAEPEPGVPTIGVRFEGGDAGCDGAVVELTGR